MVFGITIASGVLGFLLLILLNALWAVVFVGFMQLIALKTRSAAATNSGSLVFFPLLFLTPNFVPRDLLTRPMEIAATLNPVTYVMESLRSLILEDLEWATIWPGFLVVAVAGALMLVPQRPADQPLRLTGRRAARGRPPFRLQMDLDVERPVVGPEARRVVADAALDPDVVRARVEVADPLIGMPRGRAVL